MHSTIGERSFSSLFDTSSSKLCQSKLNSLSAENSGSSIVGNFSRQDTASSLCHDISSDEDDGVYLQISNLDQWYDETSLKHYLMNQLKPITPILSLTIETPSIAKVKVPSIQVSHILPEKKELIYLLFSWNSLPNKLYRIYIARKWDISEFSYRF